MQPEYRLTPGNSVDVLTDPAAGPQQRVATGEVHTAEPNGARYKVRILTSALPAYVPGQFYDIDAARLHQQLLSDNIVAQLSTGDVAGLFGDPRFTQYLTAAERGRLGKVNHELNDAHSSVTGRLAVTEPVWREIVANLKNAEPPMRPDQGTVGSVTWMIIEGNPYAGIGGGRKDHNLTVQVFPDRPVGDLPVIDTASLEYAFETTVRMRLFTMDQIAARFIDERRLSQRDGEYLLGTVREALVPVITTLDRFDPRALGPAKLQILNNDIRKWLTNTFREFSPWQPFMTYLFFPGAVEKQMWAMLGEYVAALPEQAAVIHLVNSRFSRQGDGKFLLMASRRYAYLRS